MNRSDDTPTAVATSDDVQSICAAAGGRRRAQSCSSQTLPSPTTPSVHRSTLGSPGPPTRAAASSHRRGVVRRLSPAAVEAARLAIAARQAYARRESSRSMGETALFIVTNDAGGRQQTLNEQDVALLLQGNRYRRSSRPGTPGSRRSHADHASEAGTPHSPTTPFSLMSPTANSPKHTAAAAAAAASNSTSGLGRKRISSRGSVTSQVLITVESPTSATPSAGDQRPPTESVRTPLATTEATGSSRKPSCYSTTSALNPSNGFPKLGSSASKSALPACTSTTALTASQPTRSPVKFAVAGVAMLASTSAFLLSYVLGGSRWTLVGSTVMGLGSLVFVMAICWYLANTPGDQDDERRRCESAVQIHVVDERHLARLIQQGACVKNVGVV